MTDLQTRILDAALPTIVFDGWTQSSLENAATSIGLTAFDVKRAFPGGVADAVKLFSERTDEHMLATLSRDFDLANMKIRERIATAVMVRLRAQLPYREAVRRAVAFYAMPWNTAAGLAGLYATVDAIWKAAGDTSTDYNFYTKRLLLAGVYSSTVTVWLDDTSEDLAETTSFLHRRIENVMQIEKAKAKVRKQLHSLTDWMPNFGKRNA